MAAAKRIAAVVTTYFPASHADVIVGKFVKGFPTDAGLLAPEVEIASLYLDQIDARDIGLELARTRGIPVYPSIPKALCLGGNELAVDGVLAIGEHGDYAHNEKGQKLYPRRYFFEQIAGVMATAGRSVPVFSDKHLGYCWEDAQWIYQRARQLGVPLMAGSSIPLFWRDPWLEHEPESPIEAALAVSYGDLEAYGFHGLEGLQCMVERRRGGETGVVAVQCLQGEQAWRALDAELQPLAEAALERANTARETTSPGTLAELLDSPTLFLVEYADGLRGAVLQAQSPRAKVRGWAYAARVDGRIVATGLRSHGGPPYPHFSYLGLNIQRMFVTGRPAYPVERTLLVTGVLDALLESHRQHGARVATPDLGVRYRPAAQPPIRPSGPRPVGASTRPLD